jgi:hypothetical protein
MLKPMQVSSTMRSKGNGIMKRQLADGWPAELSQPNSSAVMHYRQTD